MTEISIEGLIQAARDNLNACNQQLPKLEPMLELQTKYRDRLVNRLIPDASPLGTKLRASLAKTLRKKEVKVASLHMKVVDLQKKQIEAMEAIGGLLNKQAEIAAQELAAAEAKALEGALATEDPNSHKAVAESLGISPEQLVTVKL